MKKVAVTASGGHLGATIVNQLLNDLGKENVVGIARTPAKARHLGVEIRKGDYNILDDFKSALYGIDALVLVSSPDHPEKRHQQHKNIINAAKFNNVNKIVYTSIVGIEEGTGFSDVVSSNRQTEMDLRESGLNWVIGRNGLYLEPDLKSVESYVAEGSITNSAGNGKCGYSCRHELASAYSKMLMEDMHNGKVYNLVGEPVTQQELAEMINEVFGANLVYKEVSVEEFTNSRKEALGEFLGGIIGGIYETIRLGGFDVESHFKLATGRAHKPLKEIMKKFNS